MTVLIILAVLNFAVTAATGSIFNLLVGVALTALAVLIPE